MEILMASFALYAQGPQGEPGPPGQQGIPGPHVSSWSFLSFLYFCLLIKSHHFSSPELFPISPLLHRLSSVLIAWVCPSHAPSSSSSSSSLFFIFLPGLLRPVTLHSTKLTPKRSRNFTRVFFYQHCFSTYCNDLIASHYIVQLVAEGKNI